MNQADGKLVRDRIPELIRAESREPRVRRLSPDERHPALLAKLAEEGEELAAAQGPDVVGEMADVLEVLRALADNSDIPWNVVEAAAEAKAVERGRFAEGWYLYASR